MSRIRPPDQAGYSRQAGTQDPGEEKAELAVAVPAGRVAIPDDLTGMTVVLASAETGCIFAHTYDIDGVWTVY